MPTSPVQSEAISLGNLGVALREFDIVGALAGFIAKRLFPTIESKIQAGDIPELTIETLLRDESDERDSGGNYPRGRVQIGKSSFSTVEHGREETVDEREARIFGNFFDALELAGDRARFVVLINLEKRVVALATDPVVFTGTLTSVGSSWKVPATATPVEDVTFALKAIYDAGGLMANTLVLSWKKWLDLKNTAQIVDRIKFSGLDDPKNVSPRAVAEVLGVDQVMIAGATRNTATVNQKATLSSVWPDDKVQVAVVEESKDLKIPRLGHTIVWREDGGDIEGGTEMYRDEKVRADIVRARFDSDERLVLPEAGHVITGVDA